MSFSTIPASKRRRHFQAVEVHGDGEEAKAYTVCNIRGEREQLGLTQPVSAGRLTPIEVRPLQTMSGDQHTRLSLVDGSSERVGTVTSQTLDGKVCVTF